VNQDWPAVNEPSLRREVLARSGEFYVEEIDSTITGHHFRLYKKTPSNNYNKTLESEYSKSELVSGMKHRLRIDTETLNKLQPKVKALRALLQELDNNGGDE